MTKIKNVLKSNDYAVVHVDGVITQIGNEVTKLIFYQNMHLPTESDTLDQNEITKVLQFEIRIPRTIMGWVAEYIVDAEKSIENANNAVQNTDDEKIHSLKNELHSKIENLLCDSMNDYSEDNEVRILLEQIGEMNGRLEREMKERESQKS